MKAWTLDAFEAGPALRDDIPEPDGESIVAVKATSVNPVDLWIIGGAMKQYAEYAFPVVLGRDFCGVTADGEEVFGFVGAIGAQGVKDGAWAERIAAPPFIAPKPPSLSRAEAGAAGLAGVTALLCVEAVDPKPDERVLVVGANGGAGAFVVQLVAGRGAHVIAPALDIDGEYLTRLGAAEIVERDARPEVDVVIDLVGTEGFGPRYVSALTGVQAVSDPSAVARLGERIEEHGLQVPICEGFNFGEIPSALSALGEHKQGKLSVV
jgi:NADPH:quinone reductase-like Zn-dependent oxidoreductase